MKKKHYRSLANWDAGSYQVFGDRGFRPEPARSATGARSALQCGECAFVQVPVRSTPRPSDRSVANQMTKGRRFWVDRPWAAGKKDRELAIHVAEIQWALGVDQSRAARGHRPRR